MNKNKLISPPGGRNFSAIMHRIEDFSNFWGIRQTVVGFGLLLKTLQVELFSLIQTWAFRTGCKLIYFLILTCFYMFCVF